jgi:hypothetical protein
VRAVSRKPLRAANPKLRVVLHDDFLGYAGIRDAFEQVDACFFCLGISVRQVPGATPAEREAGYRRITRDFAMAAADALRVTSPDAAFQYLSGGRTHATSRMMWARVKAEAETALRDRIGANAFRAAFIDGADSAASPRLYQWLRPAFRLLRFRRSLYLTAEDLGLAMLEATRLGLREQVLENVDIRDLADQYATASAT